MVAIAAAVVGVAGTVYNAVAGPPDQTSTSTNRQVFPLETRQLFHDVERPLLQGTLQEQQSLLTPLLQGNPFADFLAQQYGTGIPHAAHAAVQQGAITAGVSDTGQSGVDLGGLPPVLVNALRQLALQNATQRTTAVPAGYSPFLAPGQETTSSTDTESDPFRTGFEVAGSLTSIYGGARR